MTERDFHEAPDNPGRFRPRGFTLPSRRIYKLTFGVALALSFLLFAVPSFAKTPTCFGKRATVVGTPRKDHRLRGTRGKDVIVGRAGDDRLFGRGGDDLICAGDGADLVHAGFGFDKVKGGGGKDILHGSDDNDLVLGGKGNDALVDGRRTTTGDTVKGGPGNDHILGGLNINGDSGNDYINAFDYVDNLRTTKLHGGPGDDRIYGDEDSVPAFSSDLIHGDRGNDLLFGLTGDDALYGDVGNDDLDGGADTDTCSQGTGTGTLTDCER